MTGDQALQCIELAILRVRDRHANAVPRDENLIFVLGQIAAELSEFQVLDACARKADATRVLDVKRERQ